MTTTTKTRSKTSADTARAAVQPLPATSGRLAGKLAVVTGAAGNLGTEIVRHYLREGAVVVMTGRTPERTEAARTAILAETGARPEQLWTATLDGADPESVRAGVAAIVARYGRIDILVNNAGSAGPKQLLEDVPLTQADLFQQQQAGSGDTETVADAVRNIFGVTWNLARAAAPHMPPGAAMIIGMRVERSQRVNLCRCCFSPRCQP